MKRHALSALCLALVLGLVAGPSHAASTQPWQPVDGPYGGSVGALALPPDYPVDHTVFAGLRSQGVYRTDNGGDTWQRVSPEGWVVLDLALSPDYPSDQTLFAATGLWTSGYHVYRSSDEGDSWDDVTPAWTGLPSPPCLALSPDFSNDHTLYVVGGLQTFVSSDGGDAFVQASGWFTSHAVAELAFSPAFAADQTLFALVPAEGLFRSTDGGTTWALTGLTGDYSTFALSPDYAADPMLLAVAAADGQLHVSHDGGDSWSPSALTLNAAGAHTLLFSPTFGPGDGVILAASSADPGMYRSEDGGLTWSPAGWYDPAVPYQGGFVGGGVSALALAPAGLWDARAFAGTSSGLYHSLDRGVHWWQHNHGLARLTVRALAVAPSDPNTLLAGTSFFEHLRVDSVTPGECDGNVQLSTDGGRSWRDVTGPLDRVQHVAFSPAFGDDGTAFAAAGTVGQHGYADGGVYRSTNGGQDWDEVLADRVCRALALSPAFASDRTIWVSTSAYSSVEGIQVSTDGGDTWASLAPSVNAHLLNPSPNFAVDRTLFAGTYDAGLQRSTDAGLAWTQVLTQPVSALAVSPAYGASQTLYASVRPGLVGPDEVYRSTDGGDTWQRLETGIPPTLGGDPLVIASLAFAHDGSVLAGVYYGSAAGGGGVYRSSDGGDTWRAVGTGLDAYRVFALATAPAGSLTFYAGTDTLDGASGGLWQLDVAQGGPAEPGAWESSGPRGGRAQALAVSPDFATDGVAFTGEWTQHKGGGQSGLGIFGSSDEGQTWAWSASGTEAVDYASAVHDLAFSPDFANDGVVFAATWGGLFRSIDGGATWPWVSRLYTGPFGSITAVAAAPDYATSGHVLAGSGWGGLYASEDGGVHWTAHASVNAAADVAYSPEFATDQTAFAAGWDGLWRTSDRGASWTPVLTATGASALAVSPEFGSDGTLFVGGDNLYISHDGGTSWISVTLPTDPYLINALAISPQFGTDQTLFSGVNDGLFHSGDGGLTWAAVPGWPGLAVQALAISPSWPAHPVLLAGTNQGLFRTDDSGATWARMPGLTTLSTEALALSPDESLLATGGYRHGVYGSPDRGASWLPLGLNEQSSRHIVDLAFSPSFAGDQTMFAAAVSLESIGASVYKTSDGGATWTSVFGTGYVREIAVSPQYASDQTILVTGEGLVHRSTDGGATWALLGTWPPGIYSPARLVALPPHYPSDGTVFAAGDGYWHLPPGATTWELAASGLLTDTGVSSVAVSPNYAVDATLLATAYWTESGFDYHYGVFRSTDGGLNWQAASTGLPDIELRDVAFSPSFALDGTTYLTSREQLYRSVDGGQSWTAVGRPPASSVLNELAVDHQGNVFVALAAEYTAAGPGVWRYSTPARDIAVDGGFEADSGWELPVTDWPAGYSEEVAYDGARSMRVGISDGANLYAYSSARQSIAIPADALTATLRCHVYPASSEATEAPLAALLTEGRYAGDAQYLLLLEPEAKTLFRTLSNAQAWQPYEFDLSQYAGQTVTLHFGVYNDGSGGQTAMYVDDVSLVVWQPGPAPVTSWTYLPLVVKHE